MKNLKKSLTDYVRTKGFIPDDCLSPKSRGVENNKKLVEKYNKLTEIIIRSFSTKVQNLLNEKTYNLTPLQKYERRYWQQQIGSLRGGIFTALSKQERSEKEKLYFDIEKLIRNNNLFKIKIYNQTEENIKSNRRKY